MYELMKIITIKVLKLCVFKLSWEFIINSCKKKKKKEREIKGGMKKDETKEFNASVEWWLMWVELEKETKI